MAGNDGTKARHHAAMGRRLAVWSFGLNVLIAASKLILFLISGSLALLSETVHSLTDVIGSLLIVAGVLLAEMKSERFPWGLYKAENIAALFSSLMIFASAYGIVRALFAPHPAGIRNLDFSLIALSLLAIPILVFANYEMKLAKSIRSPALLADAKNWRMDIAPLLIVAAGLVGSMLQYPVLDRVAAAVVLVLVVKAGYEILRDSLKSLLDASVDKQTLRQLEGIIAGFTGVAALTALSARNSGRYTFVSLKLQLTVKRLQEASEIGRRLEQKIKQEIPQVERVAIQFEPAEKGFIRSAVCLDDREGKVSAHFGSAPFVAILDIRAGDNAVTGKKIVANPFCREEKGKGVKLAELLAAEEVDIVYTGESFSGKGPQYVFADAEITVEKPYFADLHEVFANQSQQ